MDVGSYNMGLTCCWPLRPRKNAGKGQKHSPAADGSRLPGVEEGTDLQGGGKVSGVCFKEGHKVPDPSWVLYTDGTSLIKQGQWLSG